MAWADHTFSDCIAIIKAYEVSVNSFLVGCAMEYWLLRLYDHIIMG